MKTKNGEKIYDTIDDIPEWAESSIRKAITTGILKGTGEGLGLTMTEIKMIVWLDRCKCMDFID